MNKYFFSESTSLGALWQWCSVTLQREKLLSRTRVWLGASNEQDSQGDAYQITLHADAWGEESRLTLCRTQAFAWATNPCIRIVHSWPAGDVLYSLWICLKMQQRHLFGPNCHLMLDSPWVMMLIDIYVKAGRYGESLVFPLCTNMCLLFLLFLGNLSLCMKMNKTLHVSNVLKWDL